MQLWQCLTARTKDGRQRELTGFAMTEYAVAIDLDPEALERLYPTPRWQDAYGDLRELFARHGMTGQQDTVYLGASSPVIAVLAVQDAARHYAWFAPAVRDIRLMHVEDQSDLMPAVAAARDGGLESAATAPTPAGAGVAAATASQTPGSVARPARARGLALRRRDFVLLAAMVAIAAVFSAILIHGPGAVKGPGGLAATRSVVYDGLAMPTPWRVAPKVALRNYLGAPENIASYRGKAVLVTFLYVHCPNVCPIITSKLHTALEDMSPAERGKVQIVAISVDPHGDTSSAVAQFLEEHEMTGRMQYLVGTLGSLAPIWKAWDVASTPEDNPELVAHTALIYGVTAAGRIATIYQSSFNPKQIVHDVPLLARS